MTRLQAILAGLLGAALLLGAATAGAAGLVVAASVGAGLVVLVAALALPAAPLPRRPARPVPPDPAQVFRGFAQVSEALSWAAVSPRHYDLTTRPVLTRIAAARLAERHGVDLYADPDRARALVGEDVWAYVRPVPEPATRAHGPGVPPAVLTRIADRLEQL